MANKSKTPQDAVAGLIVSILKEARSTFEDDMREIASDFDTSERLLLGSTSLTKDDLISRPDVKAALDDFAGWVLEMAQGYASTVVDDEEPEEDGDPAEDEDADE